MSDSSASVTVINSKKKMTDINTDIMLVANMLFNSESNFFTFVTITYIFYSLIFKQKIIYNVIYNLSNM